MPTVTNLISQPAPLNWQVTARDSLSTTRQALDLVTNLTSGTVTTNLHQYVEVANDANYLDPDTGAWTESQDLIELTPDGGAAAVRGGRKVFFSPNLNVSNAITLVSAMGRTFQTRPAAICYYDSASGQRVIVATPQDSQAELSPPNTLDYPGVFGQLGYMHYAATKSGFESDLVFTSRPPDPSGVADPNGVKLDPASTTIEIWHEFYDAPVPQINPHVIIITNANAVLEVRDEVLDFGDLWFPTGKAYFTDDQSLRDTNEAAQIRVYNEADDTNSIPVAKHWVQGTNGASSWLIESVKWTDIQPHLAGLPELSQADPPSGAHGSPRSSAAKAGVTRPTQTAFALPPPAPKASSRTHALPVKLASVKAKTPSFTVDYTTISSSGSNYTFSSGSTYYIPIQGYFSGNVTFQTNCIIKYSNSADLLIYGSITCNGTTNSPSILTSLYDNSVGDTITNSTGCPAVAASEALWSYYISTGQTVSGMKISWASRGVEFDDNGCGTVTNGIANSIIESCGTGAYANNCVVSVTNSLFSQNTTTSQVAGCGSVLNPTKETALAEEITDGMEALTNGLTPANAEYIFGTNLTMTNLTYNTGSWVYGLKGLSSAAVGWPYFTTNYVTNGMIITTNISTNLNTGTATCTLITPQHALAAWHVAQYLSTGANYLFVGTNNVQYWATIGGFARVTVTNSTGFNLAFTDIALIEFTAPVTNVEVARILPKSALSKLPYLPDAELHNNPPSTNQNWNCLGATLPCIGFNQYKQAFAMDLYWFDPTGLQIVEPTLNFVAITNVSNCVYMLSKRLHLLSIFTQLDKDSD